MSRATDDTAAESERLPLSRMRRAIAGTMTASAQIPQFTVERSARTHTLNAVRAKLALAGVRVSAQDMLVKACADTLSEHPLLNASFDEDAIVLHHRIHVGLAIALDDGLLSPAILDTDRRTLAEIAAERVRLRDGARTGRLRGAELYGATFTISNLGPLGAERFTALVVPPQSAIVAVGTLSPRTRQEALTLTLSCDHRVVDGAPAAAFLGDLAGRLESARWLGALA